MKRQQVRDCVWETLAAKALQECDGIPSNLFGIAVPCTSVFDAEAVHLLCGMITPYPRYCVAEACQQVREIGRAGDLHLTFSETAAF